MAGNFTAVLAKYPLFVHESQSWCCLYAVSTFTEFSIQQNFYVKCNIYVTVCHVRHCRMLPESLDSTMTSTELSICAQVYCVREFQTQCTMQQQ